MKKRWIMMGLSISSLWSAAQEAPQTQTVPSTEYTCKEILIDPRTHQTTMLGSINFKTDHLEINKADTLIYHQKTHEIVVLGCKEFTFAGTLHITENAIHQRLRYKLGDTQAYLD